MYPPNFNLSRPTTLDELVAKREELGDQGTIYAGGTELILAMKMGMLSYEELIDIKRVPELREIEESEEALSIGGSVTHRAIQLNRTVRRNIPELSRLISGVGNHRIRASGTLAGNLAFAEPHADPPALLVALGADVVLAAAGGTRTVGLDEFIVGAYETTLGPTEVIRSIDVRLPAPDTLVKYMRFRVGERPMVSVAIVAHVDDGRLTGGPQIVLGAVDEAPRRVPTEGVADISLTDHDALGEVARRVHDVIDPVPDGSGSVDYKHHIAEVITRRALMSLSTSSD